MSLSVVLADDSVLFREGVARVVVELGFEVVAQAADADELLALVAALRPDIAIVDIRMPPGEVGDGLQAAQLIGERHPGVGVLVLSQYLDSDYALRLLRDGVPGRGYLVKDRVADLSSFAEAITQVASGGSFVDPQLVADLVQSRHTPDALQALTARELEILAMMAQGRSNAGICERLVLSPRTIESHVRTILRKLSLDEAEDNHRRVLAVLAYLRATSADAPA